MSGRVEYEEVQGLALPLSVLTLALAVLLGCIPVFVQTGPGEKALFIAAGLLVLGCWACFRELRIRVTDTDLQFGFGPFRRRVARPDIQAVEVEPYSFGKFGGWGIRYAPPRTLGYIARSGRGVRVSTSKRDYFLSTAEPEKLAGILRGAAPEPPAGRT